MRVPINFAGEFNAREAKAVSAQNAINMYPETTGNTLVMRQRRGMSLRTTVNVGPYRGSHATKNNLFIVNNDTVYKMDASETVTAIGTLATSSGRVSIADNGFNLLIVDGVGGWVYEHATSTFTRITDADFTAVLPTQCKFLDGYFLINKPSTGEFYISGSYPSHINLTTGGSGWTALDFSTAESDPDDLVSIEVTNQQILLFGSETTESWVNTGNSDLAFERQPGGVMEWGVLAPFSVAKGNNTVIWLAKNKAGQGHVVQATGYVPEIISSDAVEEFIDSVSDPSDAYAFVYKEGKRLFYVLTFQTGNKTLVYDFSTKRWHERSSYNVGRWRVATHAFFNGRHYVGDAINGSLYTLDKGVYKDGDDPIIRTIITEHSSANQDKIFCHEIQILFEQGVGLTTGQGSDPMVMLSWSKDRGHTYGNERLVKVGKIGEYGFRSRVTRCGSYRNRTWKLVMSDPVELTVIGAFGIFSKGTI